jgi:hypothetical protein
VSAVSQFTDAFRSERTATLRAVPKRDPITVRVGRVLGRLLPRVTHYVLPVAGMASISAAGFLVHIALGLVAVGVSAFVLDAGRD